MNEPDIEESAVEAGMERLRSMAQAPWDEATEAALRQTLVPGYLAAVIRLKEAVRTLQMESALREREVTEVRINETLEGISFNVAQQRLQENSEFMAANRALQQAIAATNGLTDAAERRGAQREAEEEFKSRVSGNEDYARYTKAMAARQERLNKIAQEATAELAPLVEDVERLQQKTAMAERAMLDAAGVPYKRMEASDLKQPRPAGQPPTPGGLE